MQKHRVLQRRRHLLLVQRLEHAVQRALNDAAILSPTASDHGERLARARLPVGYKRNLG